MEEYCRWLLWTGNFILSKSQHISKLYDPIVGMGGGRGGLISKVPKGRYFRRNQVTACWNGHQGFHFLHLIACRNLISAKIFSLNPSGDGRLPSLRHCLRRGTNNSPRPYYCFSRRTVPNFSNLCGKKSIFQLCRSFFHAQNIHSIWERLYFNLSLAYFFLRYTTTSLFKLI